MLLLLASRVKVDAEIGLQNSRRTSKRASLIRIVMTEAHVAYLYLVLCAMAVSWILLYRSIVRQLHLRHPKKFLAMRVTSGIPKNSVDWLFSFLRYLCSGEHRELRDPTISGLCLLLQGCSVAIVLLFVFLMFSPIFVSLRH